MVDFRHGDYATRLLAEKGCPACGADRNLTWGIDPAEDSNLKTMTIAAYDCGATFNATNDGIAVGDPCPASSNVAAQMMTYEAHIDASAATAASSDIAIRERV